MNEERKRILALIDAQIQGWHEVVSQGSPGEAEMKFAALATLHLLRSGVVR